jgi:hypothetical protein
MQKMAVRIAANVQTWICFCPPPLQSFSLQQSTLLLAGFVFAEIKIGQNGSTKWANKLRKTNGPELKEVHRNNCWKRKRYQFLFCATVEPAVVNSLICLEIRIKKHFSTNGMSSIGGFGRFFKHPDALPGRAPK